MYRKTLTGALVLLVAGSTMLCAADFWTKKKFTEWTPQEVGKMMNDSPWAKSVEVSTGDQRGIGRTGRSGGSSAGRSSIGDPSREAEAVPRANFIIRFHTAIPIKQAVMRARLGDKAGSDPQAQQFINREEAAYVVGVFGSPRFVPKEVAGLAQEAKLVLKGGQVIQATDVTLDRGQEGAGVLFFFPKGANPIKLEDDSFEVQVKFGELNIKKSFKTKDLVFDGKLAI